MTEKEKCPQIQFWCEEMWNDFVATLDLTDPKIKTLVNECNALRYRNGELYEEIVSLSF